MDHIRLTDGQLRGSNQTDLTHGNTIGRIDNVTFRAIYSASRISLHSRLSANEKLDEFDSRKFRAEYSLLFHSFSFVHLANHPSGVSGAESKRFIVLNFVTATSRE